MRVNHKPPLYISVNQESYQVTERPGYYKANLNGQLGWVAVWATNLPDLGSRIWRALRGLQ